MTTQIASIQTDGQNVIAECDATGNLQRYYIHGTTYVDEHILMNEHGKDYYYLLGALYSVVGLADENCDVVQRYAYDAYGMPRQVAGDSDADRDVDLTDLSGFVACRTEEPGDPLAPGCGPADFDNDGDCDLWDIIAMQLSFDSPRNPYLFTGRRLDFDIRDAAGAPEFALYHYRNRAYDPIHGRFLQRDPSGYTDGMNLYEYVKSRPTVLNDPTGLRTGSSEGPWISDGDMTWTSNGAPFFYWQTSVSLPTSGWLGVILETAGAIFTVPGHGLVHNFTSVSKWPPKALNGVSCYCPWKREQPCKRCVTTTSQRGWGEWGATNPTTTSQKWEREVRKGGFAVTDGVMYAWSSWGYDYQCSCVNDELAIDTLICPEKPKAKCGCEPQ